ncbi:MAG: hypothetical protein R6U50_13335 [Desulfobacterales bacterium]
MDPEKKQLVRRCPRLGGPVSFEYCRDTAGEGQPCWKILECWWEIFDVSAYLRSRMSEEAFNRLISTRPKPKITSLLEIIEKAKQNVRSQEES